MNKKNEKIIKELVWLEAVIMTYIVTFVLVMLGVSLCWCNVLYGCILGIWFLFQCVCEEKDEGQQ